MIDNNQFDLGILPPIKKYCFMFVCQKGELELQSILLAESIKQFVEVDCDIIAMIPQPTEFFGTPSKYTLDILKTLGVSFQEFTNELILPPNPQDVCLFTNKMYALRDVSTDAEKIIFLDTDCLFLKKFYGDPCFHIPISACIATSGQECLSEICLKDIYDQLGLKIPNQRTRIFSPRHTYMPPRFSTGMIAIDADLKKPFTTTWLDYYSKVNNLSSLKYKYFSEEWSFGFSVIEMNVLYTILGIEWRNSRIFHYGVPSNMQSNSDCWMLMSHIYNKYPEIISLVDNAAIWKNLFNSLNLV